MSTNLELEQAWYEIMSQGQRLVHQYFNLRKYREKPKYPAFDYNNADTVALPLHDIQTGVLVNIVKFNVNTSEVSYVLPTVDTSRHAVCLDYVSNRPSIVVHGVAHYIALYNQIYRPKRFYKRGAHLYKHNYNLVCLPTLEYLPSVLARYQPIIVHGAGQDWLTAFRYAYPQALGTVVGPKGDSRRTLIVFIHQRIIKARKKAAFVWFEDHFRLRPISTRRGTKMKDWDRLKLKTELPAKKDILNYVYQQLFSEPELQRDVVRIVNKLPVKKFLFRDDEEYYGIPVVYRLDKLIEKPML